MTIPPAIAELLPYIGSIVALAVVGALGTALEKLGSRYGIPILVAIGQRMEAGPNDLPKLIGGSRITKVEKRLEAAGTSVAEVIGAAEREAVKRSNRPPRLSDRPPSARSFTPSDNYPGSGAAILLLLAGALLFGGPTACAHAPSIPIPTDGAAAREAAKGAFAGAVLAVRATDELAASWIRSVEHPSPADIEKATAVTAALVSARDALRVAEPCIRDGGDCVEKLKTAVNYLGFAAETLTGLGKPPPDELLRVLEFLQGYVGRDRAVKS